MEIEEIQVELKKRSSEADCSVRLPEAEAEIMLAAWKLEAPFTSSQLMKTVGQAREWKIPTLISFLTRLEYRGFLFSVKKGKERLYYPVVEKERFLTEVTRSFVEQYHDGSFVKMLDSLFRDREFSNSDIDELLIWLKTR